MTSVHTRCARRCTSPSLGCAQGQCVAQCFLGAVSACGAPPRAVALVSHILGLLHKDRRIRSAICARGGDAAECGSERMHDAASC